MPHQSGVRGALGAAATGTAGVAPRVGRGGAKAGDRGAEGARVTGGRREAAMDGTVIMAGGVLGALGAAATGSAGEAPRRGTDSAKAGDRGVEGAGVTGGSREAAMDGTAETAGGVHGEAGAAAEATATRRGGEAATTPGLGRGASIAGAAVLRKEDVQTAIPCAKVVIITQMALRPAENAVSVEIHVYTDKQTVTRIGRV